MASATAGLLKVSLEHLPTGARRMSLHSDAGNIRRESCGWQKFGDEADECAALLAGWSAGTRGKLSP